MPKLHKVVETKAAADPLGYRPLLRRLEARNKTVAASRFGFKLDKREEDSAPAPSAKKAAAKPATKVQPKAAPKKAPAKAPVKAPAKAPAKKAAPAKAAPPKKEPKPAPKAKTVPAKAAPKMQGPQERLNRKLADLSKVRSFTEAELDLLTQKQLETAIPVVKALLTKAKRAGDEDKEDEHQFVLDALTAVSKQRAKSPPTGKGVAKRKEPEPEPEEEEDDGEGTITDEEELPEDEETEDEPEIEDEEDEPAPAAWKRAIPKAKGGKPAPKEEPAPEPAAKPRTVGGLPERLVLKINNPVSITRLYPEELRLLPDQRLKKLRDDMAKAAGVYKAGEESFLTDKAQIKRLKELVNLTDQEIRRRKEGVIEDEAPAQEPAPAAKAPAPKADTLTAQRGKLFDADTSDKVRLMLAGRAIGTLKPKVETSGEPALVKSVSSSGFTFQGVVTKGDFSTATLEQIGFTMLGTFDRVNKGVVVTPRVVVQNGKTFLQVNVRPAKEAKPKAEK